VAFNKIPFLKLADGRTRLYCISNFATKAGEGTMLFGQIDSSFRLAAFGMISGSWLLHKLFVWNERKLVVFLPEMRLQWRCPKFDFGKRPHE